MFHVIFITCEQRKQGKLVILQKKKVCYGLFLAPYRNHTITEKDRKFTRKLVKGKKIFYDLFLANKFCFLKNMFLYSVVKQN